MIAGALHLRREALRQERPPAMTHVQGELQEHTWSQGKEEKGLESMKNQVALITWMFCYW